MSGKSAWSILKMTVQDFVKDKVLTLSAALAYYTIFSVAPLLVIAIGVAGLVFGEQAARHQIAERLQGFVGLSGARMIESMMAAQSRRGSLIATVIGIGLL